MQLRTQESVYKVTVAPSAAEATHGEGYNESAVVVHKDIVASGARPKKLFPTTSAILAVFVDETAKSESPNKYIIFHMKPLTTIQCLESPCAEVLKGASSVLPPVARAIGMCARLATTDRLAANFKAERALAKDMGEGGLSLHSQCDVHCVAGAQAKCFDLFGYLVSNMVGLRSSLRMTGSMRKFLACVKAVVCNKLQVLCGRPLVEAERYRHHMLKLFLARGSHVAERRMSLWIWVIVDWRNQHKVEHYTGEPELPNEARLGSIWDSVVRVVIGALAGKAPSTFPRSRRTGCDLATVGIGLLLCVRLPHHLRAQRRSTTRDAQLGGAPRQCCSHSCR